MKSRRPWSAWWRSSKTMTTGEVAASRSKNVRQAANSWSEPISTSMPSRARSAGSIQARSDGSGTCSADGLGDPRARRRLVVRLDEPGPPADHLAQGPERDPVAVRRASARVPPDAVEQAVEVLEELPGEPRLPDAARADHAHETRPALPARGLEQVLELAELLVPADERRLERVAPVPSRRAGRRRGRPARPGPVPSLPLSVVLARVLEHDRARRGPLGRLAHEHGPGRRRPTAAARPC